MKEGMALQRRITVLVLFSVMSTFALIGLTPTPASAYCIDTGVEGLECVWVCPPGFTCPM
jgi:hypothetical protein